MPSNVIQLRDNLLTLDARPDRLDLRDLPYRPPVINLPAVWPDPDATRRLFPAYLQAGLILDQGKQGACTGFGLAAVINYLLWERSADTLGATNVVSPRMLYQLARMYDEWDGEDYEGSSCRGALRGWHRHGVCREALWPFQGGSFVRPLAGWDDDARHRPLGVYYRIDATSVTDMQTAIKERGAIYVSANVHAGWDLAARRKAKQPLPDLSRLPLIDLAKSARRWGGHAFAIVGYTADGFIVQNSWGTHWGASGFAVLGYADWVDNGLDAWVTALGVPVNLPSQACAYFRRESSSQKLAGTDGTLRFGSEDPLAHRPDVWQTERAYRHTLVTGNDGAICNRLPEVADASDAALHICRELPADWFAARTEARKHLVIYAHGGLNAEEDSIKRIRFLGPQFDQNGIYPLFVTWKSGIVDTLVDQLSDYVQTHFGMAALPARGVTEQLTEVWDRSVELGCRQLLVRGLWTEMKENIARATWEGRGLDAIANQISQLSAQYPDLQIHLIGHSAGAFICGRLLTEFSLRGARAGSCSLWAPACDIDFALNHFAPALANGTLPPPALRIHVLSDRRELDDSVGPYRKSLLYLVSRALERRHKTPLLGLARAFDPASTSTKFWESTTLDSLSRWQTLFWSGQLPTASFATNGKQAPVGNLFLLDARKVPTGAGDIHSSHGCFDNSLAILTQTLTFILGAPPAIPVGALDY